MSLPKIHVFSQSNSIMNQYLFELRDFEIQKDSMRFRKNLERMASLMAYEISKTLAYQSQTAETLLGEAEVKVLEFQPVLATILRAGLPMHQGMLHIFDKAENAFLSAYRRHHKDGSFEISLDYISCPSLEGKTLIICDPMLATGASMEIALAELLKHGQPSKIHLVVAIAAQDGVDHILRMFPQLELWVAAIDEELTAKSYIVPGLGDAGDLSYGSKMQY
jgi:uracil phosphoribosyltransferase